MRALRFVDPALTITGATYRGVTGCPPDARHVSAPDQRHVPVMRFLAEVRLA